MIDESTKILLPEKDMPRQWYNIIPDLPKPLNPPISPATGKPVSPEELGAIFPMGLILQEASAQRYIDIPEEVLEIYRLWRPSPLFRAKRLESRLGTPARIYYKYEGVSPAGSHKLNTAVPQAYYNMKEGISKISTETGAGQWGSAMALACNFFGIKLHVYMVRVSYEQKPYRKFMMETWGASVTPSPSPLTRAGRDILAKEPDSPGSLGMAISEAVEEAATHEDVHYALGSVLNHVCLHQTIIGLETRQQLELVGDYPDVLIGCAGGGSNFAGLALPFVRDKMNGKEIRIVAVEPAACPSLTKGRFAYDYGDEAKLAPIVQMYTLGHGFIPPAIHAGGLRYHGMSPLVSLLRHEGLVDAVAVPQNACFEAAVLFSRCEGVIPAPESSHAIKVAIDEARRAKEEGREKTIVFNLSGHGHFDLASYEKYLSGKLEDYECPDEIINQALQDLPEVRL
ncbi:MAG TPA: TrpB-like pyridoxal phosphate-dependent enzyme [Elusimicrobia bacterium]|nr:TrpB-like pyridoxal phosphate-dependent enzyme [Elusimicrobiota bacterium]HBT62998.1 TrpB-like pyridoxal phosphate-dependent enzyme [Elusimicrobiota bacterium]